MNNIFLEMASNCIKVNADKLFRIWAKEDQCIGSACVCLINSTGVGCEALRHLIVEGIEDFSLIDVNTITEQDIGGNFFLEKCQVGDLKAVACTKILLKSNPNVRGHFHLETVDNILDKNPQFFQKFDVVIASNLAEKEILRLSANLWENDVPLVYCRSLGFFGTIRIQMKHQVIFTRVEEEKLYDLRLHKPFPALDGFLENLKNDNSPPWIVLMRKVLQEWQSKNENRLYPVTADEKQELATLFLSLQKTKDPSFEEALKFVNTAFDNTGELTENIQMIFDMLPSIDLNVSKQPFWIMVAGLKNFIEKSNDGFMPITGILPDMHTNPKITEQIFSIYEYECFKNASSIHANCLDVIKKNDLNDVHIQSLTVYWFSNLLRGLSVQQGNEIVAEYSRIPYKIDDFLDEEKDKKIIMNCPQFYVAFRAYERFLDRYKKPPASSDLFNEVVRFREVAETFLDEWRVRTDINEEVIYEVCNYSNGELRSVSRTLGELVATSVKRILTNRKVDLQGTHIFNGINGESRTYNF